MTKLIDQPAFKATHRTKKLEAGRCEFGVILLNQTWGLKKSEVTSIVGLEI